MKNEINNTLNTLPISKWLLQLSVLGFLIFFPDIIGHSILWVVHTFYEATSFLLEEFLAHTFGFEKALAQLIVFYFSIITGLGASVLFWRFYLKKYLLLKYYTFKYRAIDYWHNKRKIEKMKLILLHSVFAVSAYMFLLS